MEFRKKCAHEQRLQGEKEENQWAAYAGKIALQGVLNTFSIEGHRFLLIFAVFMI